MTTTPEVPVQSIAEIRAELRARFAPSFWQIGTLAAKYEAMQDEMAPMMANIATLRRRAAERSK